ncbi:MAG: DegT/DnrJ/EryC1/StrS family aminotransferase [bacterium]|nr:DegT/DnrJ/EryC1/StrS family aminotransferase [bacterium]
MKCRVPFVNYPEHYCRIWDEVMKVIKEALSKGDLMLRHQLREFEENTASFVGVKYGIGVNSGTDALFLSLKASGIGHGDEVLTVAHTFVATISTVVHCGAKPILVDVGEDMNMDVGQAEQAITPQTRAIIPVHLNGRICDMGHLMAIADKYNLIVIEDAAQALGASFNGKWAGSFGLSGCFSFYPAKMLGGAGDGGIVVTDDREVAEKIRLLRDHGQQRETGEFLCHGFNSRLDNLQAAILDIKLKYLPEWINRRQEIADLYHQGLSSLPELKLPPQSDEFFFDVYQNYVVRSKDRDRLVAHLRDSGIEILVSWPKPLHHHKALGGLSQFHLPMTEKVSDEVLSLPIYPELSDEEIMLVVKTIHKFYEQ